MSPVFEPHIIDQMSSMTND